MLQRHDFPDALESALLDLPGLLDRKAHPSSGVGKVARVAVDKPHPQLDHPPFDLRQAPQHSLEGAGELGDTVLLIRTGPPPPRRPTSLPG